VRIALVVTEYVTESNFDGGLANYTYRLAKALIQARHEPIVFVESDHDQSFIHDGVQVKRVKNRRVIWVSMLNILSFRYMGRLCNYLRQSSNLNSALKKTHSMTPFDLVQYTHLSGVGLFRPRDIPAVARLSSYTPLWSKFGEYSDRNRFQVWQQSLAEDKALKRVAAVFGPCRPVNEFVAERLGINAKTIESPFLLATPEEDDSVYREKLAGKKYLLYYGRINRPKGVLVIAAMIHELLCRHPDLEYVFVGKETTGHNGCPIMDHVREQAGEFHHRILYLGRLPQSQLFPVLKNATAVTFPALIENFPNTCLEAMSFGQVVVVTHGTGFDQLITHGESGWMCRADDPTSLLEATETALDMRQEEREQMGSAAKARMTRLIPEKAAARHLEFYRQVIEKFRKYHE
jgi:glycogen(starch) synthase